MLRRISENEEIDSMTVDGPITQGSFLKNLGIEYRVASLIANAPDDEAKMNIFTGFQRLVENEQVITGGMGESYKVLGITVNRNESKANGTPGFEGLKSKVN